MIFPPISQRCITHGANEIPRTVNIYTFGTGVLLICMGLKDKTSGCSERLISRHLSLRLGYTPAPELVRAQREKFRNFQNSHQSYISASSVDSIYDDITLKRPDLTEPNHYFDRKSKQHPEMAKENRISGIETDVSELKQDVGSLKSDMTSMNGKMDEILEAMSRLAPRQTTPTSTEQRNHSATETQTERQEQPESLANSNSNHSINQNRATASNNHHSGTVNNQQRRPRQNMSRHMSQDDFIQREMEKDRFAYAEPGKISDCNSSRLFSKPYMYMYRDGISTIKQKLEARQSMTAPEYIDATLSMLSDPRAFHPDDYPDIFDHLRKVSRDALERPWNAVRRWTQYIWDEVESGAIVWADRDIIQEERVRMCVTSVYNNPTIHHQNTYQIPARRAQGMQEVTCRAYNTRNGCQYRESHVDGNVYALHICTYCDSLAKTCYHSVRECERRITHTRRTHIMGETECMDSRTTNQRIIIITIKATDSQKIRRPA